MCLLMKSKSGNLRRVLLETKGLLADIYASNADGYGAMFVGDDGRMVIHKALPKSVGEFRQMVEKLPQDDRDIAMHLRMRTHGDIDLENCHPYKITGEDGEASAYLMHNGVLSMGNATDTTKSDTWHYCRDYLDDLVDESIHDDDVLDVIGKHIGANNVFAIMTKSGRISLVNEDRGIEAEGVFFSNTYAWSPELLGVPGFQSFGYGLGYGFNWGCYGGVVEAAMRGDIDSLAEALAFDQDAVNELVDDLELEQVFVEGATAEERQTLGVLLPWTASALNQAIELFGAEQVAQVLCDFVTFKEKECAQSKKESKEAPPTRRISEWCEDDEDEIRGWARERGIGRSVHAMSDDEFAEMEVREAYAG